MPTAMSEPQELLVLAVESSAARSAVALLAGPRLLAVREFPRGSGGVGAGSPAAAAEAALAGIGRKPADIGLVAVSVGPGSYTGLRIGVSFAKTFAWATGAAVAAVPSLRALAEDAAAALPEGAVLVPTADAFRGQLYARAFRRDGPGQFTDLTGDLVLEPAELVSRLAGIRSAPATGHWQLTTGHCCFGSGAARHQAALSAAARAAGLALEFAPEPASPSAEAVGRIGLGLFLAGKAVTAHDLVPVYLRKTEAEERAEARQGKA